MMFKSRTNYISSHHKLWLVFLWGAAFLMVYMRLATCGRLKVADAWFRLLCFSTDNFAFKFSFVVRWNFQHYFVYWIRCWIPSLILISLKVVTWKYVIEVCHGCFSSKLTVTRRISRICEIWPWVFGFFSILFPPTWLVPRFLRQPVHFFAWQEFPIVARSHFCYTIFFCLNFSIQLCVSTQRNACTGILIIHISNIFCISDISYVRFTFSIL